ncbi:sigma 54-interacting transcriptional regulator [Pseudomonas aeruginosa]|uniref:sigma 54-interacting transcriptional regulator n=1 Tax=Pseudomonas aeruginosa TaxID=287 RepID=UPI001559F6C2|nr:sigma 54-interacting transcriptional regulator [Pseudomonas aeruginosa]NPW37879.1 sigma-54-dependent Fis family transcriptional regulator [Pseudomonas aeruginosa]
MDILQLAPAIRDLARAKQPADLAEVFLRAAVKMCGLNAGCCYWRDAAGQILHPLAGAGKVQGDLPAISMDEMDNPLVYSLVASQRFQVETLDNLIGVGDSFEQLRQQLPVRQALHITPLRDEKEQVSGVLAVVGAPDAVRQWGNSDVWQMLVQAYEHMNIRVLEASGATDTSRRQQAEAARRDGERGSARAAKLLAAGFVGTSGIAKTLRNEMLRLSDSSLSLLITGETGTGKDHAAWLIHQASSREGKFIPVNCAAIPKDLIEAELFGVVRGAYTGATQARNGLVAEANGGTLFLDEIGDMPLGLQGTLLRLLNEKRFRPVGATREQDSDFRLICATHRSLPELVNEGLFREDLYFRICQHVLHMPALRERVEDIPALASYILLQFNREHQRNVMGVSARALVQLQRCQYPGNIRELRNLLQSAAERVEPGRFVRSSTLAGAQSRLPTLTAVKGDRGLLLQELWHTDNLPQALQRFEESLVRERLRQAEGSRRRAAESLGIPKRTLARKCQSWNLDVEQSTT